MSDADWELFNAQFDAVFRKLYTQARRIEDLETRVESLMREQSARTREADTFGERFVLHIPDPAPQPRCPRCEACHSPELPCPTPVDEAWARHGGEAEGVPA